MPFLLANPYLDAVLVAILLYAVVATWDTLFGPVLRGIAQAFDVTIPLPSRIPDIHLGFIANAIRHFEQVIRRHLGLALAAIVWPFAMLLEFASHLFLDPARELYELARDTTATIDRLRRDVIPAFIAAKIHWIPAHLNALEDKVAGLLHRAPVHITQDITKYAKGAFTTVVHKAVALPWPRLGKLEREAGQLGKKIDRIARKVTPAALAAAIVATIARSSFRWIRCSPSKRLGNRVCGMDSDLLDALIAGSFLIVGAMSLREFAIAMQDSIDTISPQVTKFWRA